MNEQMLKDLLGNEAAMAAMPQETKDALRKQYEDLKNARERREEAERKRKESESGKERAARSQEAERDRKRLGLDMGEWVRKIPRERRFVIAHRVGKEFTGWCGQEKDPTKWKDIDEYVPMDILRGYMAPYFGYFQYIGPDGAMAQRLKPALDAKTDDELLRAIKREFDFFKYEERDDKYYGGFSICQYDVDENWHVTIKGHGEIKPFAQHFADLKAEFDK